MPAAYPRLAGFYFFYFAALGLLLPYWSPYLADRGFGPEAIGLLLAIGHASRLYAPYLCGWLADAWGRRMPLVRLGSAAAALSFSAIYLLNDSLLGWALLMLAFNFFWNAMLPQFEAVTLNHLGKQSHRYSRLRLWGSIGFIVTAGSLGAGLDRFAIDALPALLLALFTLLLLNSLLIADRPGTIGSLEATEPLGRLLRRAPVLALFAVSLLIQASHGPYYTFFTIQVRELGYSGTATGLLWALAVAAEVLVFVLAPWCLARYEPRRLLLVTLGLTGLRWLLTGTCPAQPLVLAFAQSLHGFSFGLYHTVAIALVHRYFTGRNQGRGQALLSSVGFGLGGALGSLAAGLLWQWQGPAATYAWAAGAAGLGGLIAWRGLR